jgi:hypothetical protein
VVVDEHGAARWRVDVPNDLHSFVAINDHRVILRLGDDSLRAWDVATGKPVS